MDVRRAQACCSVDDLTAVGLATRVHDGVELACGHLHAVEVLLVLDEASNGWSQELPTSDAATIGGRGGDAGASVDWVRNPLLRVVQVSLPDAIHPFFPYDSSILPVVLQISNPVPLTDDLSPLHLISIARVPVYAPANPAMTMACRSSPPPKTLIYLCGD
ncbi:hypothetical protein Zm00014a_015543 [Zea mays]|uniref:Uncharacterized protein n=1 Tax=Zea mays TaxID=4577 RepID=A0A3L6F6N1_MAIZE|nr:hypothetical protein Zm00014a_015543 [Zea mays]